MRITCQVHRGHRPGVVSTDIHHIWPLGHGGPDSADNTVVVCPTGHRNIHQALSAMLARKPIPKVARKELKLAKLGYDRIIRKSM